MSESGGCGEQRVCLPDGTEAVLAAWRARVVARGIDMAIVAVVMFVAGLGAFIDFYRGLLSPGYDGLPYMAVLMSIAFVVVALYEVLAVAIKGRTRGMSVAGIVVVGVTGRRVSLGQAALRWIVPAVMSMLGAAVPAVLDPPGSYSELVVWLALGSTFGGLPVVWLLLWAVALRDDRRRGVHDWAAGTIVVQAEAGAKRR